jgi:hypothetical protein
MGNQPRNAMKGITLEGETCTVMVGAQEGGTRIGLLIFRDGQREPEGVDFPYEQAAALHEVLGSALESVRGRLG